MPTMSHWRVERVAITLPQAQRISDVHIFRMNVCSS